MHLDIDTSIQFFPKNVSYGSCNIGFKHKIFYVGPARENVKIMSNNELFKYFKVEKLKTKYRYINSKDLLIEIDTTYKSICYDDENALYKGLTVRILNHSNDSLKFSMGDLVNGYIEAINKKNQWKSIGTESVYMCNNGDFLVLPPKYVVITSVPLFEGELKTKLRFNVKGNYSNEINASLDTSVFIK